MVRLFTGFKMKLSDDLLNFRSGLMEATRNSHITWVHPDKFHITLHFFGDVEESVLPIIYAFHSKVVSACKPFTLKYERTGYFGSKKQPQIIWYGYSCPEEFQLLHATLVKELKAAGFRPEERKFHPHITLGRIKGMHDIGIFNEYIEKINRERISHHFEVNSIQVIKSILKPQGPEYQVLYDLKL